MAIIGFAGNIGTGKTLNMIAHLSTRQPQRAYTNFRLYNVENYQRMKLNDIIKPDDDEKSKKWHINYDYWKKQIKKYKTFCLYVDELPLLANSRTGMSNINRGVNMFLAQIRKILAGNETNDFVFSCQRPMSVDVGIRDLVHVWILCEKIILKKTLKTRLYNGKIVSLPIVIIKRFAFKNTKDIVDYMNGEIVNKKRIKELKPLIANEYYYLYNTHELVDFGNEYL